VPKDSIRIVPYEQNHQAQVLALAIEMQSESISYADMPMNERKLVDQFECAITMPDTVYLRLAVRGEEVIGAFFGTISEMLFTDQLAAKDVGWFVKSDRRGGFAALLLHADFEQWALSRGIRHFFLGQSTGVDIEKTTKLYQHLGYQVVGVNAMKVLV